MTVGRSQVVGRRYLLQRQIGRGGMGPVWLAVDEVLGREVAVKRVGLFPGGSSPDLLRAQREAKLAARLNHPHVVSVFDFVTEGDEQWLVMEYVAGTNLAALADERRGLPPAQAAELIGQVAEALAAAHAAGIVHRDVKPSNILVTEEGTAKLADFGIARARADSTRTATGMVTGTPAYLAPEVASGKKATEASDVWSLGATLFHTLSGAPPYDVSDNVLAAMYRIVHEDPPRLVGMPWPAELLETTMAPDPEDRWPMRRVREYLAAGPPRPRSTPPPVQAAPTEVLPAVAPEPLPTVAPEPLTDEPSGRGPQRSGAMLPVLLGIAVLLVGAVAGWALLRGDPTPTASDRPPGNTQSQTTPSDSTPSESPEQSPSVGTTGPSQSESEQPDTSAEAGPAAMRSFVQDYIDTALTDPAAAWQQLSPRFQERIGSYGSYSGYWNTIDTATLRDVEADPEAMEVSYVITWDPEGPRGKEDEVVVLELVRQDGQYLIDWER